MPSGLKHLITCRCVLPQFKQRPNPPPHQFTVFSIVDDNDVVRVRFEQCNNCGIIHKVIDVCKSEIVSREAMNSLQTIDDIKSCMNPRLANLLEANNVDLATWQAAQFIVENRRWGEFVVLSSDEQEGMRQGKYLMIIGENMFKVDTFTRDEVIS